MFKLVDEALTQMNFMFTHERQAIDMNRTFNIETEINNYRNELKNKNVEDINDKKYQYQDGVYYMDIISEAEKLGDYVLNVVQAVIEKKI